MTFENRFENILQDAHSKNFALIKKKSFQNHPELHCEFLPFIFCTTLFSIFISENGIDIFAKSEESFEKDLFEKFFGVEDYLKITDFLNGNSLPKNCEEFSFVSQKEFFKKYDETHFEKNFLEDDFDIHFEIKKIAKDFASKTVWNKK